MDYVDCLFPLDLSHWTIVEVIYKIMQSPSSFCLNRDRDTMNRGASRLRDLPLCLKMGRQSCQDLRKRNRYGPAPAKV